MMRVIGVDIGGTRMRAGLIEADGTVSSRVAMATTDTADGPAGVASLLGRLAPDPGLDVVIGLPGRVDYRDGALETGFNLPPGWVADFRSDPLARHLGRRVHLANDADLAAVGEAWFGAGRDHDDVLYVTLSTGIGAGLILGRRLVAGRRSAAEVGHTVVDLDGTFGDGTKTVETLGSGTALGRAAEAVGLPTGPALVDLVRAGDASAHQVWHDAIHAAAVGIANMCWIAAPSVVVVGGGMGRNGDLVLDPIRATLATVGPTDLPQPIVVAEAQLGDDAGLAGAAGWFQARGL